MSEPVSCPCGSQWFELRGTDNHAHGAFTIDDKGVVTGFAGTPVCLECGLVWEPPRNRLRVV